MNRLKSLFYATVCAGIVWLNSYIIWDEFRVIAELSNYGRQTVGTVSKYEFHQRRGRRGRIHYDYNHTIVYDGHSKVFDLGKQFSIGTQFYVFYSTRQPTISRVTRAKQSMWALAKEDFGWFGLLFFPGIILVFGLSCLFHLKEVFVRENEKPDKNIQLCPSCNAYQDADKTNCPNCGYCFVKK